MAARLDATNDSYTRALALGAQTALTMCSWVYLSADRDTYSSLFFVDNGQGDNWGLQTTSDGTTMWYVMDGSSIASVRAMTVGQWYWFAIATSGTTGTIYHAAAGDTALTSQAGSNISGVTAATLRIGESPWSGEWLNGRVAAVKAWIGAQLTAAELHQEFRQTAPVRTAGLTAFYPFVRAETTDYSGNARTLSGGVGATTEDGPPIPWRRTNPRVVLPTATGGAKPLDGAASAAASATGSLLAARSENGLVAAAASATASLSEARALAGTVSSGTSAAASATLARPLAGAGSASSTLTGDLSIAGDASLNGVAASAAHATALLTVVRPIEASSVAAAAASGGLAITRPMAGVVPSAVDVTPTLTLTRPLAGSLPVSASAAGILTVPSSLVGFTIGDDVTGPGRVEVDTSGPTYRRTVTGPAVRRALTGPETVPGEVSGPDTPPGATPTGVAIRRDLDGPNTARVVTGPEV